VFFAHYNQNKINMGSADETFATQLARAKGADGFLAALDQVWFRVFTFRSPID